jgi:hypothetical protein
VLHLAEISRIETAQSRSLDSLAEEQGVQPLDSIRQLRGAKITSVVAGMVAGADSIDDLDVIRHGALLGCSVASGHRRRWARFFAGSPGGMCVNSTPLLPGADSYAFLDVDSTINRVYGYAKQGADYGYTRVRGLHPLLATISTRSPLRSSPVPACVGAGAGSAKGAASFVAEAITTARQAERAVDLRRPDRRDHLHRIPLAAEIRADHGRG